MSKRFNTPGEAWDQLKKMAAKGRAQPAKPVGLPLRDIKLRPEVFQQRKPAKHISAEHIRTLAKSIQSRADGALDPMTVWWDGRNWVCIDGHHRHAAYTKAGKDSHVPVQVFDGSLEDALVASAMSNTRDKLKMSRSEKMNASWRMTLLAEGLSKVRVAEAAGISPRQVAIMRNVKQALQQRPDVEAWDAAAAPDLASMSWDAARRMAAGEDAASWDEDEDERRAHAMAESLRKALGPTADRQPEIFAKAVALFSPSLADGLADYFRNAEEDPEETAEEEF